MAPLCVKTQQGVEFSGGFIFQDGKICTTSANMVDADGVEYDHAGNNAYYSTVEWSSENRLEAGTAAGRF